MCLRFHIEFVLIYDEHISLLPKILYTETTLLFLSYPHIQTFYASSNFSSPFHILFFFFQSLLLTCSLLILVYPLPAV